MPATPRAWEWDLLDGRDPVTPDAPLGPWLTSPVRSTLAVAKCGLVVVCIVASGRLTLMGWVGLECQWGRGSAGGKIHSSRAPNTGSMEEG